MTTLTYELSPSGGPVYSGRERGESLRKQLKIDNAEDSADLVKVTIPSSAYTVSSSFFLGLFGPSVQKCGSVDKFERKFQFTAPPFLLPLLRKHAALALQPATRLL